MEDLSGSCASQAHFSEAAAHMLQLAQDAFAAVIFCPDSGCPVEIPHQSSPLSCLLSATSCLMQPPAATRGQYYQQQLRVASVLGSW